MRICFDVETTFTYTNHRGETAARTVIPLYLWHGATEHHPTPRWLLRAYDKGKQAERDFDLAMIHTTTRSDTMNDSHDNDDLNCYAVEPFGGGWIVADYSGRRGRFGVAYAGADGVWRSQPVGMPPFPTREAAEAFAAAQAATPPGGKSSASGGFVRLPPL